MAALHCTKRVNGVARAGMLGLALTMFFAQVGARAADDDNTNSVFDLDTRIIDGFAKGLGLKKGDDLGIDYRERAPLVIPPSRNLPPPQAATANRGANWPVDPDIKRRQDAATNKALDRRRSYDEEELGRSLRPSELGPPGKGGTATAAKPAGDGGDPDGSNNTPSQLGYFGGLFGSSSFGFGGGKEDIGTFKKEPPRTSLTEPPVGYQTPSAAQPYGVGKSTERRTVTPLDPAVGNN